MNPVELRPNRRPGPKAPEYDLWTLNRLMKSSYDDPLTGCRVWTGQVNKKGGYGRIGYRYKSHRAHRLSYSLFIGPIPDGMHILHSCDNPLCINPNHLRPGTHSENISEAYRKGRKFTAKGEDHHNSKISNKQAREIFYSDMPTTLLANKYNISRSTVWRIKTGRSRFNPFKG